MICHMCQNDNQSDAKFCGYCGSHLSQEIVCPSCQENVNSKYSFCPYCSHSFKNTNNKKQISRHNHTNHLSTKRENKTKIISAITHSLVILLSVGTLLGLFGNVSTIKLTTVPTIGNNKLSSNLIDYYDATYKGISGFDRHDFENLIDEASHKYPNLHEFQLLQKMNILTLFVASDGESSFTYHKTLIYGTTLVLQAMVVLSLIAIGFGIYDLSTLNSNKGYKRLFIIQLILSFVLMMFIHLLGGQIGYGIILYMVFIGVGLIYSYIIEFITKERSFNGLTFGLRLPTAISLFILVILSSTSILKLKILHYNNAKIPINYGKIASIIDYLSFPGDERKMFHPFAVIMSHETIMTEQAWLPRLALVIPVVFTIVVILLVLSFLMESMRNLGLAKKSVALPLVWTAFGLELLVIGVAVAITIGYNQSSNTMEATSSYYSTHLSLSIGYILFTVFTLIVAIYRSVVGKWIK